MASNMVCERPAYGNALTLLPSIWNFSAQVSPAYCAATVYTPSTDDQLQMVIRKTVTLPDTQIICYVRR